MTVGAWAAFRVVEICLDDFAETVLPQIKSEGFLLNAFPVGERTGFVVTPDEFIRDLNVELEKYL